MMSHKLEASVVHGKATVGRSHSSMPGKSHADARQVEEKVFGRKMEPASPQSVWEVV